MKHQTKPTFFVTYTLLCYKTIIKRELDGYQGMKIPFFVGDVYD